MGTQNTITIHTDGGARGNPGPAAIGVYITENNEVIAAFGKQLGVATNNVAEYMAVVEALQWLIDNYKDKTIGKQIIFYLDSQLVASQLMGIYKIKNPGLRELLMKVRIGEQELGLPTRYVNIPREQNKEADQLVNQALDNII